ncbi:hypothetical protein FRC01_000102, partial [Tulasnella sp. 417]
DLIENFGGLSEQRAGYMNDRTSSETDFIYPVAEDPQKAIIVIIIDRNTHLGSKLIMEYAGESSGKGVVDQAWILESIRQGRMLGPPDWGGYALHRHTVQTYFNSGDLDENTPGIAHTASPVTMDLVGSHLHSIGHTPSPSLGTPRFPQDFITRASLSTPQEPVISVTAVLLILEGDFLFQQNPPKQPKSSAPQAPIAKRFKFMNESSPQKADITDYSDSDARESIREVGLADDDI